MQITVSRLPAPIHEGDWHDKPLRWTVLGPETEVHNFSTKAESARYKSLRRRYNQTEAVNRFVFGHTK